MSETITGMIYGQAIADALGKSTEFMSKSEISEKFNTKKPMMYANINRVGFSKGDWTDDTDQMILILDCIVSSDYESFPTRIFNWVKYGFPELGDTCGNGIGSHTMKVLSNPRYLVDPLLVSWEEMMANPKNAPNGGVMRTCIVGTLKTMDCVVRTADLFCKMTHYNIKCRMSCVFISSLIHNMIYNFAKFRTVQKFIDESLRITKYFLMDHCSDNVYRKYNEFVGYLSFKNFEDIPLAMNKMGGYTYIPVACAVVGLKLAEELYCPQANHPNRYEKIINQIIYEGGDADTNAAVAGAVLGAYLSSSEIPSYLIDGIDNKTFLDERIKKIQSFVKNVL